MARSPTESIDIELFQDDFKNIDQEFLQSVISIFSFFPLIFYKIQFLLMTKDATYAYGKEICSWLSLEDDMEADSIWEMINHMIKPQRISCLDDMKIVQVDYGRDFVAILTDDGRVYLASDDSNWKTNKTLRLISNDNHRFKMIACGQYHVLMLRKDGHVFAMGCNSCGQITGNEKSSYESMVHIDKLENVKLIVCGMSHNFSLTNNGEIYSWGSNHCGQLGLGDNEDRDTPCLVAFSNDDLINIRIKDIVAGRIFSLFLFENGQLWGCGSNNNGELGFDYDYQRSKLTKIPIENVKQIVCSKEHNFSIAHDGSSYYAWGRAECAEKLYLKTSPEKLNGHPTSIVAASAMILSSKITFGLKSTIYVFGSHDSISYQCKSVNQLFDNQDSYDVEFSIDKKHIKACKCYLKSVSEYYRLMFSGNWSENDQVIINDYSYETYYAYLLMLHTGEIQINRQNITELVDLANCYDDETLMKCCEKFIWNDRNEQTIPTYLSLINKYEMKVLHNKLRNMKRSPNENIDIEFFKNDFKNINQEFLQSVVSIFSFFTFKNNKAKKQFLLMTKEATYAYGKRICSWLLEDYMDKPERISRLNGDKIVQAVYGHDFVALLTYDGRVYLASDDSEWETDYIRQYGVNHKLKTYWNTNKKLRLISNDNDRFKMIACGHYHLVLLRQDGHVFAMGYNGYNQILATERLSYKSMIHIYKLENVKLIACGRRHSVSITNNGEIYTWGCNDDGRLGLGDEKKRNTICLVPFPNDDLINIRIKDIAAGDRHSLVLFENGQLWGFGSNRNGELGLGDDIKLSNLTKIPIENVQQIAYSYDVEFLIDKKRIKACKCYLKSVSEYYRRMFSGNWIKKDQVPIQNYSYETYYAYVHMLHTGKIHINHQNITELVDLANCYSDDRLMEYCETFIRNDLDEQTMPTYLPLIEKYEMKELCVKLAHLDQNLR
ncbi:hypothetical protein HUG17_9084 [Dermatophagoides farinae]|uniref:BTB domain-containing protein n=1 Tax=Dermatophagoides farinae TaxID=6954 RepID=A0A9D4NRF2_DERFA|nr:hypothetical protein HUG17_9084 [Dermatophagoides farinae]